MPGRHDIPVSGFTPAVPGVKRRPVQALRRAGGRRSPVVGAVLLTLAGGYGVFTGESPGDPAREGLAPHPDAVGVLREPRRTPVVFQERGGRILAVARHDAAWSPVHNR